MAKFSDDDDDNVDPRERGLVLALRAILGPDVELRGYLVPRMRPDSSYIQAHGVIDRIRHRYSTKTTDYAIAANICIVWTQKLYNGESIEDDSEPAVHTFHFIAHEYNDTVNEKERKNVERLLTYIPVKTLANAVNMPYLKKICKKIWPDGTSTANELRHVYGPARAIRALGEANGRCTALIIRKLKIDKPRKVILRPSHFDLLYENAEPDVEILLDFLISCGPRAAEAVLADLREYEAGVLTCRDIKAITRQVVDRKIKVYPKFAAALDRLLAQPGTESTRIIRTVNGVAVPAIGLDPKGVPDAHQVKVAERFVNAALKDLGKKCGIRLEKAPGVEVPLTMKIFRTSWATYDLSVYGSISDLRERGGWKTWTVIMDHYADKRYPEWVPDIARIWGIDLDDLPHLATTKPDRPGDATHRRRR